MSLEYDGCVAEPGGLAPGKMGDEVMAGTSSRWREESRRIIQETLKQLPKDVTLLDCRRALRKAYPFGQRQYHPYRMWCAEVRKALAPMQEKEYPVLVGVGPDGIDCGWCGNHPRGCLCCAAVRDRWLTDEVTDWKRWQQWLDLLKEDPTDVPLRLAFSDWLEDHGWPGAARNERLHAEMIQSQESA